MHEVPRIPCFLASAAMRALSLRAFTRRRSVVIAITCVGLSRLGLGALGPTVRSLVLAAVKALTPKAWQIRMGVHG